MYFGFYVLDDDPGGLISSNAWCRFADCEYGPVERQATFSKNKDDKDFEAADPICWK